VILTIKAELSEPPSEPLPFRDVTMASKDMELDVLIECEPSLKDLYWRFLKPRGMLDYVDYLITPREEKNSIRLDTEFNFSKTIVANRITIENSSIIIKQIEIVSKC
tara:strand:- start:402 stop:722 length:321 start_codon:yes stop_codon:yes gene_type:complete